MNSILLDNKANNSQREAAVNLIEGLLKNKSVMKHCGYDYDDLSEEDITEIVEDMLLEVRRIDEKVSLRRCKMA
jgi:(2Fe-2S) ferredoxin